MRGVVVALILKFQPVILTERIEAHFDRKSISIPERTGVDTICLADLLKIHLQSGSTRWKTSL